MPKEIKTKITIKDIKILDKAADVSTRMKDTFVLSKDAAEQTKESGYNSPDYATEKVSCGAELAAGASGQKMAHYFKNPKKNVAENMNRVKKHFQDVKRQLPKERKRVAEQAQKTAQKVKENSDRLYKTAEKAKTTAHDAKKAVTDAKRTLQQTRQGGQQTVRSAKQSVKTGKQAKKTIKTSAKTLKETGKGTIKTVKQSLKTAECSAKTAVKTAQQTAKSAQRAAQASVKAEKIAAQTSKAAAKAAAQAAKATAKAVTAAVKATMAAVKGVIAIIAAGGFIAVVIIIVICLVGLLAGSVFGVFFSDEDSGSGHSMTSVVQELQLEIHNEIEDIINTNTHDALVADDMFINWPEILSVYAVKVNANPDNPVEVVTLDDDKINELRSIFNDMILLFHSTETQERIVKITDVDGNETETTELAVITTLTIAIIQKSADDMAVRYGFSQAQKNQMHELLSPEYADLWIALLHE